MGQNEHQLTENPVPAARRINPNPLGDVELHSQSVWFNPTDVPVRLELYVGTRPLPKLGRKLTHEERTGLQIYEIPPKESASLPSTFDKAIQDVRGGVIVGGLGPQLKKKGTQYTLHPSLDEALARAKAAKEAALKAIAEKEVHTTALLVAEGELIRANADAASRDAAAAAPTDTTPPKPARR